jgi:hypothetical protein
MWNNPEINSRSILTSYENNMNLPSYMFCQWRVLYHATYFLPLKKQLIFPEQKALFHRFEQPHLL